MLKKNNENSWKNALKTLVAPLTGKPALVCSLVLIATLISLDLPAYAPFFLLPIPFFLCYFEKSVKLGILFSLFLGILIHELPKYESEKKAVDVANEGCGNIEAILNRSNGKVFIVKVNGEKNSYRLRLSEKREFSAFPSPGDSLCFQARLYPVQKPSVPGGFDTQNWLNSQGFAAYGQLEHWTSWQGNATPETYFLKFREWIKSEFEEYLTPGETGLLLGLLAGDKSGIPEALKSDFQRSGLIHVLAISGFHVVLLAGMLMVFLKATRLPHTAVRIIAILLLILYIPITGNSPAIRRAVIMFSIPELAALFQRKANPFNSLGVALFIILLFEPHALWNPGFQLSFAATAGILIGTHHTPFKNLSQKFSQNKMWLFFENFILSPTYVTLCATLATSPFLIHHFKTLSPFAWLGNIVVVPGISLGMQAGLFALLSPFDFLEEGFCNAASFFLRFSSLVTNYLSSSTNASLTVGPLAPPFLILLGFCFLLLTKYRTNLLARRLTLLSAVVFALLFFVNSYGKIFNPKWFITVIDIGQGDSILLTTPSNKHFLIDAGDNARVDSGKDIIVPYFHHSGIFKLDALVITHPDKDHFGGALSILKSFPVDELWVNTCATQENKMEWQYVLEEARDRGVKIREIGRGFSWKELHFEMQALHPHFNPTSYKAAKECNDANRARITLRLKGLGHSAILTGDLTAAGEREIMTYNFPIKSDILKLGHHGSKTSSTKEFLTAVNPEFALISSGRKNRFRHPSKEVIERLDSLRIPYYDTQTKGTIQVQISEDSIKTISMW